MSTGSIALQRVFTAPPEKVFKAFASAEAMASWIPPFGFICTVEEFDFKVGGNYKMTFINFGVGKGNSFGGKFVEIKENEYVKYSNTFDNPNLQGEIINTVWFKKVLCGTEIKITQEGIPSMIPVEMCYLGWQESLEKLKKLVEPVIPDAQ